MGKKMDKAVKVTGEVAREVMTDFNNRAKHPLVSGVSFDKDMAGYHVSVELNRLPTDDEKSKLPKERDGVRIKYGVPVRFT